MPQASLPACLARNAAELGNEVAFRFLGRTPRPSADLTFHALFSEGERRAGELERLALAGRRIGILCPEPRDFILSLAAVFLAGAVAVPMPAVLSRRGMPRVDAILQAADLDAIIAPQATLQGGAPGPPVQGVALEVLEQAPEGRTGRRWRDGEAPALLQFTSGSTSRPRGVQLSHANIAANCTAIVEAYALSRQSIGLSWLPLHHDMGLIGHVLAPMWLGIRSIIMDPLRFLQRPIRWLEAVGDERATITSAPNFAYELCNRAALAPGRQLDLGSLATAVCGGEPVMASTMEAFCERFAPHGFRRAAFAPSYGLAEATLLVASGQHAGGPRVMPEREEAGALHRAAPLTSVGPAVQGTRVRIVDGATGAPRPGGAVGEIEVAGPGVGRVLGEPAREWVRTGDLGLLSGGELYIAGRSKELLIVRGQNVFPADIEAAALAAGSGLVPGGVAAVGDRREGTEMIVIVAEARAPAGDEAALRARMSSAVAAATGHVPSDIRLVAPGSLPRTTSGKLRRGEIARLYREAKLVQVPSRAEEAAT